MASPVYCSLSETPMNKFVEGRGINFYRTPIIKLLTLPSSSSRFICLFAKDILHSWLLHGDAAIAESRCSNELPGRNRATERIKKAVISLLSGKSTEPKVDDSQGATEYITCLSFGCYVFMGVKEVSELCSHGEVLTCSSSKARF